MAALSKDQVATLLRNAGFPEDKVPLMVNIASRESGLRPDAHNPNAATGDNSYGLFQINMLGNLGPARLREYADIGVKSYEDLKDPWKNVQAAKKVFDSQGLGAWTTYQSALKDPAPVLSGSGLDVFSEPRPQASAGRSNEPLVAAVTAMLGSGRIDRPDGMAMGPGSQAILQMNPGAAAQVAAIKALFSSSPRDTAQVSSAGISAPAGGAGLNVIEYLTGDKDHAGYREDHGGDNYHEHLAFGTKAERDSAMQKLKAAGIQIGSVNDGRHAPGSYHYQDLAFDVPAAQVPVGQEQDLSRRVRSILGIG
jgi:hypothetical protein